MQDWLLRQAGYKPLTNNNREPLSKEFYLARWQNRDISDYWKRMCKPAPPQEPVPEDPQEWVHSGT
jgi:hypothetical protein